MNEMNFFTSIVQIAFEEIMINMSDWASGLLGDTTR